MSELIQADLLRWLRDNQWLVNNGHIDRFHCVLGDPPYFLGSIAKRFGGATAAPARYGKDGSFGRLSRGFMGKCYHPDTEVLTEDGWMNIRELVDTNYRGCAYTLNLVTRNVELSQVMDHQKYEFNGELIHFDSRSIDLLVTPNHHLVVSDEWGASFRRADDPRNTVCMLSQGDWQSPRISPMVNIGSRTYDIEPLMRFLGVYLGDGCVVHRKNQPYKQDFISISTCQDRKRRNIRVICDELELKYAEYDKQTVIYNKDFNEWLTPIGHAHEKYIPEWVFHQDRLALEELWQGLLSTDGHSGKNGSIIQYFTCSKRLADDVQRLLLHIGLSGTMKCRKGRPGVVIAGGEPTRTARDGWVISVHKPNKTLWFERVDHKSGKVNAKPYPYNGFVYDITVAENHTLYTRRNGRCVWSSNSWDGFEDVWQYQAWVTEWATLLLDYVYPGAILSMFGGNRTMHRLVAGLEDAGWEPFDQLQMVFSTGFPKSTSLSKLIDQHLGVEREVTGTRTSAFGQESLGGDGTRADGKGGLGLWQGDSPKEVALKDKPATDEAVLWDGYKGLIKPAFEPVILARAPRGNKSFAELALEYGTGSLNIDGCRIPYVGDVDPRTFGGEWRTDKAAKNIYEGGYAGNNLAVSPNGRYPANLGLVCTCDGDQHDPDCPVRLLDEQSGYLPPGGDLSGNEPGEPMTYVYNGHLGRKQWTGYKDGGGASRFLYTVKPGRFEREAGLDDFEPSTVDDGREKPIDNPFQRGETRRKNIHPTIKSIKFCSWLATLLLPPPLDVPRRLLVPFAGSGSEMIGARFAGWDEIVGIERESEYCAINEARRRWWSGFDSYDQAEKTYKETHGRDGKPKNGASSSRQQFSLFVDDPLAR